MDQVILTSAVVAAVVSSGAHLLGHIVQKRATLQLLLFSKALEFAEQERGGRNIDPLLLAEVYLRGLKELHRNGRVPDKWPMEVPPSPAFSRWLEDYLAKEAALRREAGAPNVK